MERWWCIDCRTSVHLNTQAKCECCGSDAVDTMERGSPDGPSIQPSFSRESAGPALPMNNPGFIGNALDRILEAVL